MVVDTKRLISVVKPSIPALMGPGGGLVVASADKASLLGSQFDSKQCCEVFVTPVSNFQSRCNSLAFRTPVLLRQLLDLETYVWGVDPIGSVSTFLKMVADVIVLRLRLNFHRLIRLGSFPECWRSDNATAIPMDALSPDKENYRPISV